MTHDPSVKDRFIDLRAKGTPLVAIARELKIHPNTAFRWNQDLKDRIAARHALELDALARQFYVLKEARITLFGRQLDRLLAQLDRRGLKAVPPDKLLNLVLKYAAALKREERDLRLPTLDLAPEAPDPAPPLNPNPPR